MKYTTASLLTLFVLGLMIPSTFAEVPDWVKNTAGWWATDAISETEFVNAIAYLAEIGIIQLLAIEAIANVWWVTQIHCEFEQNEIFKW